MKFLEIIEVRSHAAGYEQMRTELIQFANEINASMGNESVRVYTRYHMQSDFSVHIEHSYEHSANEDSHAGSQLMRVLRDYGLVNRTVWIQDT